MILATLVILATTITHQPCAVIDNHKNIAVWTERDGTEFNAYYSRYTDYGDNLGFEHVPDRSAWSAINAATAQLKIGKPGYKIRLACR